MIKLNNKNITYVALADSNNSLKAPKEIWYADSNNSVKLVYRRKDALIEGEDYEKYHFVKGDGSAYIRTNHTLNENLDWEVKVANFTDYKCLFWQREGEVTDNLNTVLVKAVNYYPGLRVGNKSSEVRINPFTDTEITVSTSNDTIVINGQTYQVTKGTSTISGNFVLFYTAFNLDSTSQDVCCAYFRFVDSNRNYIQNLIPCKLLKPVPKWLDANGIRRQIGECGMIDLVSGKFYGNVNSVGTFTVENYYERKEWLVGDGSAYIDTGIKLTAADVITTKIIATTIPSGGPTDYYIVYGNNSGTAYNTVCALFGNSLMLFRPTKTNDITFQIRYYVDTEYEIVQSNTSIDINNQQVWQGSSIFESIDWNCLIFASVNTQLHNFNGKIAYFLISDKINLVPCKLLASIPASMDANNIARTKGTSGMWDLVSDRFYGNVANSGTFKAVNLAEGVDYEVHQWLKVEISANEARSFMTLPLNSSVFEFKRKFDVFGNLPYFSSSGYTYVTGTAKKVAIYDKVNGSNIEISNFNLNTGDVVDVVCDGQELYFNNQQFTMYENPWRIIYFRLNAAGSADFSTSKISIDGIERYIPVKLLRSIPSTYDANGIARQVGECGMYDTVNDVFYGNVASSGTFSVEDDS